MTDFVGEFEKYHFLSQPPHFAHLSAQSGLSANDGGGGDGGVDDDDGDGGCVDDGLQTASSLI